MNLLNYIVRVSSNKTAPKLSDLQPLKGEFDFKSFFLSVYQRQE